MPSQIWAIGDRSRAEALAGLEATERAQLLDLLERIHGNLNVLVGTAEPVRQSVGIAGHVSAISRGRSARTARTKRAARIKRSRVST